MERGRRIGEAERHHKELEVPMMRPERVLGHVIDVHADLVIAAVEVKLGEVDRMLEFVQELLHHGDGEFVAHGLAVEGAVVDANPPRAVTLTDEKDRQRERRCARLNNALLQHSLALSSNLIFEELGVPVWAHCHRRCARKEVNPVVARTWRREAGGTLDDGQARWRSVAGTDACPMDDVVVAPEQHGEAAEVPEDGAEGTDPVAAQDEVVACKRDGKHVDDKVFGADAEGYGAADAGGWHPIAIGDADGETRRGVMSRPSRCATVSAMKQWVEPMSTKAGIVVSASIVAS